MNILKFGAKLLKPLVKFAKTVVKPSLVKQSDGIKKTTTNLQSTGKDIYTTRPKDGKQFFKSKPTIGTRIQNKFKTIHDASAQIVNNGIKNVEDKVTNGATMIIDKLANVTKGRVTQRIQDASTKLQNFKTGDALKKYGSNVYNNGKTALTDLYAKITNFNIKDAKSTLIEKINKAKDVLKDPDQRKSVGALAGTALVGGGLLTYANSKSAPQ